MPVATRESKEFSITIRTGEPDGVCRYEKEFLDWLESVGTTHYVVAYEQKGDLSTQHFQCAVVFRDEHRSDNLKKTLVALLGHHWNEQQRKHAVCVNKNRDGNDICLLAGGYCLKQDVAPFIKGWTSEELEPYLTQYEELKNKSLLRNISRERLIPLLQEWHDEISNHKNPDVREVYESYGQRKKLEFLYRYGISLGADLQRYSTLQWINYLAYNFDVLIERVSPDDLLDKMSSDNI